jgi:hypothetical protein
MEALHLDQVRGSEVSSKAGSRGPLSPRPRYFLISVASYSFSESTWAPLLPFRWKNPKISLHDAKGSTPHFSHIIAS